MVFPSNDTGYAQGFALDRGITLLRLYWSAHAHPVICQPGAPFFRDMVTTALSVTGWPSLVKDNVVGTTR